MKHAGWHVLHSRHDGNFEEIGCFLDHVPKDVILEVAEVVADQYHIISHNDCLEYVSEDQTNVEVRRFQQWTTLK